LIGRVLVLAAFLTALGFTLALIGELALRVLGEEVTASVTSIHEKPDGKVYSRSAHYTYTVPGQPQRSDQSRISYDAFRKLREPFLEAGAVSDDMTFPAGAPGKLAVRAFAFGPVVFSRAVEHEYATMVLVISAIFAPVSAFFFYALYLAIVIRPRRYRRIFSNGIAVPGTIVAKYQDEASDSYYFAIKFSFTPVDGSGPLVVEAAIPGQKEYKEIQEGDEVTVLYDPDHPRRASTYEYGGFIVEERISVPFSQPR